MEVIIGVLDYTLESVSIATRMAEFCGEAHIKNFWLILNNIPSANETAAAIKRGAPWTGISQTAEKEGLHYISKAIFVAEEERLASERTSAEEPDISMVSEDRIREFRRHLPDSCETAAAIDRDAPWSEISQCAERDGLHQIASFIFEAEQQGLED